MKFKIWLDLYKLLKKLNKKINQYFREFFEDKNLKNSLFYLKNKDDNVEEIEEVESFLKTVYEVEKKVLKFIGGIENE